MSSTSSEPTAFGVVEASTEGSSSSNPTPNVVTSTMTAAVVNSVQTFISSTTAKIATTTTAAAAAITSSSSTTTDVPTSSSSVFSTTTASTTSSASTSTMVNVADLSSSLQHFGVVDYLVFVLMLVICAIIGFYFGFIEKKQKKKKKNIEERRGSEALDYLVGGRKMKVFPVSLSLVASFVSGISLLGTSTEIYVYGTQYAFILITLALSGVISWYVFLPVFCNLQLTSTYEYFEMRFDRSIRYFASVLFIVGMILYLPVAIYVPALTFNLVTGISVHTITSIVCMVCTFYTCVGGLKAVIWSDAVQSFVMFGTVLVVCIKGTFDVGGLGIVLQRNWEGGRLNAPDMSWDPTIRISMASVIIGGTIHKIQSSDVNQMSLQRFMSLPNMHKVKQTLILFTILLIFLLACCSYMGLLVYANYYDCDPLISKLASKTDQVPSLLIMRTLGMIPGLPGLFVAGVFSAALSSLSTGLNSLSCVICQDLIKPLLKNPLSDRQTAILLRLLVVIFGITCIFLVFVVEHMGTVLQLATMTGAVPMGALLAIYTTGVCIPWFNSKSVLAGGIVSFLTMSWLCFKAQLAEVNGEMKHPKLPVSIEGCTHEFNYFYVENNSSIYGNVEEDHSRNIYHLSFFWYTGVGFFISMIVSALATLIFGTNKLDNDINMDLYSPVVHRFLPKNATYISESLENIPLNKTEEDDIEKD